MFRTNAGIEGRTDGQRENSIPTTNKVCGGYNYVVGTQKNCLIETVLLSIQNKCSANWISKNSHNVTPPPPKLIAYL